jgi:hypothetical protein
MKQSNYIGFNGHVCTCDYVRGEIDGEPVLVVKQIADLASPASQI